MSLVTISVAKTDADREAIERTLAGVAAELLASTSQPRLPDISDRQFGEGLWRDGLISFDDYLGFVGPGTIPPRLMTIIEQLPDDETGGPTPRKVAIGTVTGAKTYQFADDLVETIRQFFEDTDPTWTVDYLRDRWTVWATL